MEHIRTEHGEGAAILLLPLAGSQMEKKGEKRRFGACFLEEEQRSFLWYGPGSFGRFMAFNLSQSFLEGPGVKSEDRYMGVFMPRC